MAPLCSKTFKLPETSEQTCRLLPVFILEAVCRATVINGKIVDQRSLALEQTRSEITEA